MRLSADPHPTSAGSGGLIAEPGQVTRIWERARAEYRRQLAQIRSDVPLAELAGNSARQLATAGELALSRGGLATSRFITRGWMLLSVKDLHRKVFTDTEVLDPLVGMRAWRINPTCIVWDTTCPPEVIEESPLFDAFLTACEQVHWRSGHGAVLEITPPGGSPELIWHTGYGADLIGRGRTAHIYR